FPPGDIVRRILPGQDQSRLIGRGRLPEGVVVPRIHQGRQRGRHGASEPGIILGDVIDQATDLRRQPRLLEQALRSAWMLAAHESSWNAEAKLERSKPYDQNDQSLLT